MTSYFLFYSDIGEINGVIVLLFLFKMKQYTEIFFFTVFKIHIPAITFEIVTGLSKIKKKKKVQQLKTACGFKVDTS